MKNTKLINLYGGPGISKSTTAAGIFTLLKLHGVDCELVTEFAKDLVWEDRKKTLQNQEYIFGKQYHRLWRLNGQVDVIITDSPLLFSLIYGDDKSQSFKTLVWESYMKFNNYNFLLNRIKPYNPNGREQTEEEAKKLDFKITEMLNANANYKIVDGNYKGVNKITENILTLLSITNQFFIDEKWVE